MTTITPFAFWCLFHVLCLWDRKKMQSQKSSTSENAPLHSLPSPFPYHVRSNNSNDDSIYHNNGLLRVVSTFILFGRIWDGSCSRRSITWSPLSSDHFDLLWFQEIPQKAWTTAGESTITSSIIRSRTISTAAAAAVVVISGQDPGRPFDTYITNHSSRWASSDSDCDDLWYLFRRYERRRKSSSITQSRMHSWVSCPLYCSSIAATNDVSMLSEGVPVVAWA